MKNYKGRKFNVSHIEQIRNFLLVFFYIKLSQKVTFDNFYIEKN